MLKDGKYRYTLQFGRNSAEEIRAGTLLEKLGRRKSTIVVKALNEYLLSHPELLDKKTELHIHLTGAPMNEIENRIRELIDKRLSECHAEQSIMSESEHQTEQISNDIMDMIEDLDLFT